MKRSVLAASAALLLTLTACSSGDEAEPSPPPTEETVAVETTPAEPLTQAEWVEMCAAETGTEPDNPRCNEDMDAEPEAAGKWDGTQGEWVAFRTMDADDTLHDWSLRVDSAEITTTIPDAADNPEYMSGEVDGPEVIDAESDEGSEYLVIDFTSRNDSNTPDRLPVTYAVHFSDGEIFQPVGDDEDIAYNLTREREPNVLDEDQNPGSEAEGSIVFSIPQDSEVAAVEFQDAYLMSEFFTTIELTDITR